MGWLDSPAGAWVRELRGRLAEVERAKSEARASRRAVSDYGSKAPRAEQPGVRPTIRRLYSKGSEREPWRGTAARQEHAVGPAPARPGTRTGAGTGSWKATGRFPVRGR